MLVVPGSAASGRDRNIRKTAPATDKAWINAKTFCCFPLSQDDVPRTGQQLARSMVGGWKNSLMLPDPAAVVDIEGGRYPAVDSMRVDLSKSIVNPSHTPAGIGDYKPTTKGLTVEHFQVVAEPMLNRKSRINIEITGTHVRLDLQHDKNGKPILMLTDALEGTLHFDASHDDLQKLVQAMAREKAASHAVSIRSTELDLQSIGPRSVLADLHVSTAVGFIPAGMRFTARVDIDDHMNARISNLTCVGDDILGPLIVGLIHPAIAKYNNTTHPLISFPSGQLKLRDVQIQAGEHIDMTARFSR